MLAPPVIPVPPRSAVPVDLLRWPGVGPVLRRPHTRTAARLVLLGVAVLIVVHGLTGPQIAPRNLSSVLTWVHYRGLLIGALLLAGNLFCGACPMVLVRDVARRWRRPTWRWPRWLGQKWVAVVLFAAVLFGYELFDLWALPAATAWLLIGYFGTAVIVDLTFSGAAFCKHVCPVGQFSFVASTLSPLEVQVRETSVCASCRTADCINGREIPGRSRPDRTARVRARPVPAGEGGQSGLHVLPRLRPRLSARQRHAGRTRARATSSPTIAGAPRSAACPRAAISRRSCCSSPSARWSTPLP